jgi:hypothetical protein
MAKEKMKLYKERGTTMNNAQLYILVTKVEQAERAHLLGSQRRARQTWPNPIAAVIAQVAGLYQRWKTGKPTRSGQSAEPDGAGWRPASEVVVEQSPGVE